MLSLSLSFCFSLFSLNKKYIYIYTHTLVDKYHAIHTVDLTLLVDPLRKFCTSTISSFRSSCGLLGEIWVLERYRAEGYGSRLVQSSAFGLQEFQGNRDFRSDVSSDTLTPESLPSYSSALNARP